MLIEGSVDLSRAVIAEPLDAYRVHENRFAIAEYSEERPFLITCGLAACKAIAIHSAAQKRGLLAHVSVVDDLERDMAKLVAEFGGSLEETDIHIVKVRQAEPPLWPTLSSLRDYFFERNPRSLRVDPNYHGNSIRGVALRLDTGQVSEIDGSDGWTWSNQHDTSLNKRIVPLPD